MWEAIGVECQTLALSESLVDYDMYPNVYSLVPLVSAHHHDSTTRWYPVFPPPLLCGGLARRVRDVDLVTNSLEVTFVYLA